MVTWKHFKGVVPVQTEDQSAGGDAEDLSGGKVHPVVDLDVETSRHGTFQEHKESLV